jgi:hypothetical protein
MYSSIYVVGDVIVHCARYSQVSKFTGGGGRLSPHHEFGFILFIDIFVNCNWVDTRWQYTFTHKQYIEQHN